MMLKVHVFYTPVKRFIRGSTDSERVVFIILKYMSICWILVTSLKDLANLPTTNSVNKSLWEPYFF